MGARIMIFAGGIPVKKDGIVIGAIGVNGGTVEQDHAVLRQEPLPFDAAGLSFK